MDEYARIKAMSAEEIEKSGLLAEVYFDFDKAEIREADRATLAKNADALKRFDFLRVTVEGHCDERGTVEYNLALGERRARAAYDYLVSLGVPADRLKTVSYGKEVPVCTQSTEECWQRNRRAHLTVTGKTKYAAGVWGAQAPHPLRPALARPAKPYPRKAPWKAGVVVASTAGDAPVLLTPLGLCLLIPCLEGICTP